MRFKVLTDYLIIMYLIDKNNKQQEFIIKREPM